MKSPFTDLKLIWSVCRAAEPMNCKIVYSSPRCGSTGREVQRALVLAHNPVSYLYKFRIVSTFIHVLGGLVHATLTKKCFVTHKLVGDGGRGKYINSWKAIDECYLGSRNPSLETRCCVRTSRSVWRTRFLE